MSTPQPAEGNDEAVAHPRERLSRWLESEMRLTELKNEAWVARFAVVICVIVGLMTVTTHHAHDATLGKALLALIGAFALYEVAVVMPLLRRNRGLSVLQKVNCTIEVSFPTIVSFLDVYLVGAVYALTSTPPLLTFVAVIASGLRLKRWLSFYAGALAAAQFLAFYAFARSHLEPAELEAQVTFGWITAINHAIFLAFAGFVAAVVARIGRTLSQRVARQATAREHVTTVFGEYIAPQAVEKVLAGEVAMLGERREVTVLFADIRDFTPLASAAEPEQVVTFLNEYFDPVCEAVARHHGMVNKFMGDGLLAIFGAPEPDPEHALHAATAALELAAAARAVNRPDGSPVRAGVGVHTGPVVLGSIGSPRRKDYTAIGDTVNTASRLEGLTRDDVADVLISEEVVRAAGSTLECEAVGPVTVKGRSEPVIVHRLLGITR